MRQFMKYNPHDAINMLMIGGDIIEANCGTIH